MSTTPDAVCSPKAWKRRPKRLGAPIVTTVYSNGFPKDMTAFDNADTVVSYCDGGEATTSSRSSRTSTR